MDEGICSNLWCVHVNALLYVQSSQGQNVLVFLEVNFQLTTEKLVQSFRYIFFFDAILIFSFL